MTLHDFCMTNDVSGKLIISDSDEIFTGTYDQYLNSEVRDKVDNKTVILMLKTDKSLSISVA